ncbi:MAG TPA: helix-turn-helix transcriptional regulator [Stellaceae bacterium]|nr:helix-turn-helix transcriptional regulator [Stellaceae bacterium]
MRTGHRRRTAKESGPDPIDIHVGKRLRLARERAGLTQVELGAALGMSFQVVQKYEQGEIRVSASRLVQLSRLLKKPAAFFFEALDDPAGLGDGVAIEGGELELVHAYRRIVDREVRQRILQLVRDTATLHDGTPES